MVSKQSGNSASHSLWLSRAALGFVALAAVMGWGASFVGLHAYGQNQMVGFNYWTAWLVPGTFDGAAFGATLITYRASIHGRSALRGRLLMWTFTAISSWINWIHQVTPEAQLVAAGLPVAAVAVFDVVLAELRADYEERHGKRRLRLRPGLLLLRWIVDRTGTSGAFRRQVTDIPVSEIAGLGQPVGISSYSSEKRELEERLAEVRQAEQRELALYADEDQSFEPATAAASTPAAPASSPKALEKVPEKTQKATAQPGERSRDKTVGSDGAGMGDTHELQVPAEIRSGYWQPHAGNGHTGPNGQPSHNGQNGQSGQNGRSGAGQQGNGQATAQVPGNAGSETSRSTGQTLAAGNSAETRAGTTQQGPSKMDRDKADRDKAARNPAPDSTQTQRISRDKVATVAESYQGASARPASSDAAREDVSADQRHPAGAVDENPEDSLNLPPVPEEPLNDQDKRTLARRDYSLSVAQGRPLSGAQLGRRYGFSERWGRSQIAAVREERTTDKSAKV